MLIISKGLWLSRVWRGSLNEGGVSEKGLSTEIHIYLENSRKAAKEKKVYR